jgi:hypothetical protein
MADEEERTPLVVLQPSLHRVDDFLRVAIAEIGSLEDVDVKAQQDEVEKLEEDDEDYSETLSQIFDECVTVAEAAGYEIDQENDSFIVYPPSGDGENEQEPENDTTDMVEDLGRF